MMNPVHPGKSMPKLRKLLGPSFRYRLNPNAPTKEERDEAKAEYPTAAAEKEASNKRLNDYRDALLKGDAEYQRLRAEYQAAVKRAGDLAGRSRSYRITAGKAGSMGSFSTFWVEAEGDTWGEIVAKLEASKK